MVCHSRRERSAGLVGHISHIANRRVIGGLTTYLATTGVERRRDREETRLLALSIQAEAKAGMYMLALQLKAAAPFGDKFAQDTLRYARMPADYAPIARGAAPKAGRFPRDIAEALARMLILMQNLRQQQETIAAMREAGVLNDDRMRERATSMGPIALELPACVDELARLVDRHYGKPDKPWYRRSRRSSR